MDPRLLKYYNEELQHVREMGGEFAKEFPKIASRLGLDGFECADPYVERLLEGFAFLAARVQLKIHTEFPRFTQHLLEMVYPHYLAPTPSMAVVQLQPDLAEGSLGEGFTVPRGSVLRSPLGKGDQTPCEYRTGHDVTLWPLELTEAEYFTHAREMGAVETPVLQSAKAGLRLRLRTTAGLSFDRLALDSLPLYLRGGELSMHLLEQLLANALGMVVAPARRPPAWREVVDRTHIRRLGFEDRQALLPFGPRSFQGYRLLHEYFAFPDRFMFVELAGLGPAVRRCKENEIDITVLLDRGDPFLLNAVGPANFALFCSPAINLFPRRSDSIHLTEGQTEYHVVPDRTVPMDYEVYDVIGVVGSGTGDREQEFLPFYSRRDPRRFGDGMAYYTLRRTPRVLSSRQREVGPRASYIGSEVFLALVDAGEAPYRGDLRQLALTTLCTNRDLPLHLSVGQGRTDFNLQTGAPVATVRCLAGPTHPRPSRAEGETAWRLISHLTLNYLSLLDTDEKQGAVALRDLLLLYGGDSEASLQKQVEGVRSVTSTTVTRRLSSPGPIAFGRGLEVTVAFDEAAFGGSGVFLLGAVLEQFFARYATINSFTETVVKTLNRGEIIRWPARTGQGHAL
ncbi:MAG: type VI secretion system baseplate subunit TssF [Candidatus Rokubacteria bacterium]|nr:type VI secretion system baseplate subunit TssF [Candidatus Rokubacteria bacterium]